MSKERKQQIEGLIEFLTGTAKGDAQAEADERGLGTLTKADLQQIDEAIFRCETCDWWCSRDEESTEQGVCDECVEPGCEDD